MRKKFKTKKSNNPRKKFLLFFFLIIISFAVSLSYFSSLLQKEDVLNFLVKTTLFAKKNISSDPTILDFLLDYTIGRQTIEEECTFNDVNIEYIKDPNPKENKSNALIYIYNTHQSEEYKGGVTQEHNITPTVMLASYKFREELNKLNLPTLVETNPISDILRVNGWNYASSYKASKLLMQTAYEENPSLKYFIDFHRDAISYENSIVEIKGKTYAKVLFVIGTDHEGYEKNLELANSIDAKINELYPGLSRGVIKKGGKGVNGIYNQDFSNQTLLFEVGGQYNKINEVNLTVTALAHVLKEVIGDL